MSLSDQLEQLQRHLGLTRDQALEVMRAQMLEHLAATSPAEVSPIGDTDEVSQTDTPQVSRSRTPDRWQDLGRELDEVPTDDPQPGDAGLDALARLFEHLERYRPAWHADALCLEYPDLPWFPDKGDNVAQLKAVCERCSVAAECRSFAVENGIKDGCWGGLTGRGLRKLRADAA